MVWHWELADDAVPQLLMPDWPTSEVWGSLLNLNDVWISAEDEVERDEEQDTYMYPVFQVWLGMS